MSTTLKKSRIFYIFQKYALPHKYTLTLLFFLVVSSLLINLLIPQFIKVYIDNLFSNSTSIVLRRIAFMFIFTVIVRLALSIAITYVGERLGWITSNKLREDLIGHCIDLDMDFHNSAIKGELLEKVEGDISFLGNFLSTCFISIISSILVILGISCMLMVENLMLGAVMLIPNTIIAIALLKLHNIAVPKWVNAREKSSDLFGFIEEYINGKEDIKARKAQGFVFNKLEKKLNEYLIFTRKASFTSNLSIVIINSLYFIGNSIGFGTAIFLYTRGSISLGVLYLVFNYLSILYGPWQQLRMQVSSLQQVSAGVSRISNLLEKTSSIKDGSIELHPNEGAVSIKFENVKFSYTGEDATIDDVTFNLEKYKKMGVIGRTGCGKTTLVYLLLRFYNTSYGGIYIDGINIENITTESIRRQILLITQNVQIFNASVRDNITLFSKDYLDSQITSAICELGLKEWLDRMDKGLDTIIKPDVLSTGESQLLAFARAYLKKPSLIIFDEATAYLHPQTEQLVQRAFNNLLKGKTAIIIAHRLKTLDNVDTILVLNEGKVIDFGDRDYVKEKDGSIFAKLLEKEKEEAIL